MRRGTFGTVCPPGAIISRPGAKIKLGTVGTASLDTTQCLAWKGVRRPASDEVRPARTIQGARTSAPG